jgi:hypothetical protein
MNAKDPQEYAAALDEINRKVAAGEMTEGAAVVWRRRLLDEMGEKPRPLWARVMLGIALVIIFLIIVRFLMVALGYA